MSSHVVQIDGDADGGKLLLRIGLGGLALDIEEPTYPNQPLHLIAENLFYRVRDSEAGYYLTLDHAGPMLLINGAEVVEAGSGDDGITVIEYPVADGAQLSHRTYGMRPAGDATGPGNPASADDPDQQVLGHLARMVGSLADSAAAEGAILKGVLDAHHTLMQGTTALLTGTPLPVLPNPGSGGTLATDADTTTGLLASLADNNVGMARALGKLADARGAQLGAAAAKEEEAKKGTPGTTTGGPTTTGTPTGTGGGPGTGGGEGSGQPGTGGGSGASGEPGIRVRPAGSKAEWIPFEPITKCMEYTVNGTTYLLGGYADGSWCLGRLPQAMEISFPDGTTEIRPESLWFDIPIDKVKWDAMIAELQKQATPTAPKPEEFTSTLLKVFSFVLDCTPLGSVKMGIEAIIGHDLITWDELDASTRAIYAVCALMATPIGAKLVSKLGKGARALLGSAERSIARGEALTAEQIANLRKLEDAVAEARTIKCAGEEVKLAERSAGEVAESGRVLPEPVCFLAGTLVHLADGEQRSIERLNVGDRVRCARDAATIPATTAEAEARIDRVYRRDADQDIVALTFERDGRRAHLAATATHCFGTDDGYRAAGDLSLGSTVLARGGGIARLVARSRRSRGVEVFNLEVPRHHNFFVTDLGLLVHNGCEAVTQREVESMVDRGLVEGMEREAPGISEQGFSRRSPINRGRADINDSIAEAKSDLRRARDAQRAGQATEQEVAEAERKWKEWKEIRSNCTFPDVTVVQDGRRLALELKTPKDGQSLFSYFNARYRRGGVKYGPESFIDQMNMRKGNLPTEVESVLTVDLRFMDKARVGSGANPAALAEHLTGRAAELRNVLSTGAYEGANVGAVYKEIRFVIGDFGAPQLSAPFPFAP